MIFGFQKGGVGVARARARSRADLAAKNKCLAQSNKTPEGPSN